ncbi:MAG TPA: putative glycolipid-binding domain-containing protein [Egicoccus sp.]|nr:putative glycolipid-binding domain-containing protein [Egicoccus sp.]HSK22422.1 putative glycolipid-binding domain-containing protein [Egicoccus sp.]
MHDGLVLRPVSDDDGPQLVDLIGAAYAEYPGCVLDLPDLDADLPVPATTAARRGGRWWVVEDAGRIVASVGTGAPDDGTVELKRLYVAGSHRRRGLAAALVARVEAQASGVGAQTVRLWSDTRFGDAHRLYTAQGYADTGARRDLHDPSHTTEIQFSKPVAPPTPRREVAWTGPFGPERLRWYDLPDGVVLRGVVAKAPDGRLAYDVEVDAQWRTRRVQVSDADGVRTLAGDGTGTWWRDGAPADDLTGCLDVDIESTPATNTLPIRRVGSGPVTAAWVRVPGPTIEPLHQSYEDHGERRWTYRSNGGFVGALQVDDDGLVVDYLQQHADGTTTPIWTRT